MPAPTRIEIIGYPPDVDVYPILRFEIPNENPAPRQLDDWEDYYQDLDEAIARYQREYGIEPAEWEYQS